MIGSTTAHVMLLKRVTPSVGGEGMGPFIPAMRPKTPTYLTLSGVTRDSTGAVLPFCTVRLYRSDNDQFIDMVVSAADGSFTFTTTGPGQFYYEVAYLAGSPDVTGATVDTLQGT